MYTTLFFMNILPSLIRSHYFLSPAILISESSAVSVLNLNLKQSVPLPYASIVRSKLDYCNYYNLPKSQINHLQQIQNCLARTVDINTSHSPTKFLSHISCSVCV